MNFRLLLIQLIFLPYFITFAQQGLVKSYYPDDTLKSEINYSDNIREGAAKFYFPNGKIRQEVTYQNGKIEGLVKVYSDSGKISETYNLEDGKREGPASLFQKDGTYLTSVEYKEGKLLPKKTITMDETQTTAAADKKKQEKYNADKIAAEKKKKVSNANPPPVLVEKNYSDDPAYYMSAEIMPEPAGGMKALLSKVYYPAEAKKDNIKGVVKIKTYIDQYGNVTRADIVKGIGHGCDEAAKIAVFYAKFKPGLIKGQPVKIQMIIPIKFPPTDDTAVGKN